MNTHNNYIKFLDGEIDDCICLHNYRLWSGTKIPIQNVIVKAYFTSLSQDKEIESISIKEPEVPYIKIVPNEDGVYGVAPNYEYLKNNYSEYINKEAQDYISIFDGIQKALENKPLVVAGNFNMDMSRLAELIVSMQNFLEAHPNSVKFDEIKKTMYWFIAEFIGNKQVRTNKHVKLVKDSYDKLLKTTDSESEAHKIVAKAYKILESNNFNPNDEYRKYIDDIIKKYDIDIVH